jgi:hypothetical protein
MFPNRRPLLAFASVLAALVAGAAFASPATVTQVPNNFPNVKQEPPYPGMNAIVDVTSGTAKIVVLHASTVTADGHEYTIANDQKLTVEVKHHASVVSGTFIIVDFDGVGTYSNFRGERTVKFAGHGSIDQDKYDAVRFFGAGQVTAANWISVEAHDDAVVKTIDVRDVVGFENADVTVTNCWIANGFSSIAMKTTGCRYPQGNAVAVPAKPAKE